LTQAGLKPQLYLIVASTMGHRSANTATEQLPGGSMRRAETVKDGQMTLALAPIGQRVSSTLEDVRRNGQTLLSSAQLQLQRQFSQREEATEVLLGRLGKADTSRRPRIRKSASEANIQKPRFTRALSTAPREASPHIDWLGALNQKINQARNKNRPQFQLPFRSEFGEQVSLASNIALRVSAKTFSVYFHGGHFVFFSLGMLKKPHPRCVSTKLTG
jgi:hypothetical protein